MFEELLTPPPRPFPLAGWRQLRRATFPLLGVGAALVVMAIAAQVALSIQHREARTLAQRGVPVEGTLVDRISGRYVMRLTVAYRARDHRLRTVRQWVRANPANRWLLLGDHVRVVYDPAEPDRAYLDYLAEPGGALGRSLPVALGSALALLAGAMLLAAAGSFARSARRFLQHGLLVPARLTCPASWKNLWLAQYEVTREEKVCLYRGFVPPGWQPAAGRG